MNILKTLEGKKTYITAVVLAVLNLLVAFGVITPDHLSQINTILGALGLGFLRVSVK